jgi:anaerobic ribonucleoside-triphosphate reductase activating protein
MIEITMLDKLKDIYVPVMGIVDDSVVDGERLRLAVFVQGCPRHCQDCHNPQSWAFTKENMVSLNEIYTRVEENALCSGITLSGGEPFIYAKELALLADAVKAGGKMFGRFLAGHMSSLVKGKTHKSFFVM